MFRFVSIELATNQK